MNTLATATLDDELSFFAQELDLVSLDTDRFTLERSLYEFVKGAWHLVEPGTDFIESWHLVEMCTVLEACYRREIKRVIFNVPPGTLKSLLVQVFFPAWVWAKNAKKRFLTASYGQHLTTRDNLRCRQIVESPWFQSRWPVHMLEDQNAKTRYNTDQHGWRIATSVRGVGTGEHPDYIIIDDPTSAAQARSEADRTSANEWFDTTISTRLGRNPVIIVVMQRLHEEDMSGHLAHRGGWERVVFPMRYEVCRCSGEDLCALHQADAQWRPDPRDHRTVEGELLCPALADEAKVRQLELDLGPIDAAGQLQQRPSPGEGGLFKIHWWKYADQAPALMRTARGWDTASTEDGGDWTCGIKIGEEFEWRTSDGKRRLESTGRFFVLDEERHQLGPDGVDRLIEATAHRDGKDVAQREEKEGGSAGAAVIQARAKKLKGFNYQGVTISGSKVTRAKPFRAQVEAGNVYLVRAPWNQEYVRELAAFPNGKHDDRVDGSSTAFNAVLLEEPPAKRRITWGD